MRELKQTAQVWAGPRDAAKQETANGQATGKQRASSGQASLLGGKHRKYDILGHRHAEAWKYYNPSRRTTKTQLPGVPNGSPAAGKQRPASTPFIILERESGNEGDSGLRARGTDKETWHSHWSKVLPQREGGASADGAGLKADLSGRAAHRRMAGFTFAGSC